MKKRFTIGVILFAVILILTVTVGMLANLVVKVPEDNVEQPFSHVHCNAVSKAMIFC